MADVKREKELAEKRKNEPQLGSNQDHLVRKIFSKFKRAQPAAIQSSKDVSQSDVEKGDTTDNEKSKLAPKVSGTFTENKLSVSPIPSASIPVKPRSSKWGKLLGSSSVDSASDTSGKITVSRSLSARDSLRESIQGRASSGSGSSNGGSGNKVRS